MQCNEPEMRHFLQIGLCNKAGHFSILKKNTKLVNTNVLNFSLGFKGLYHSPFSKVCIIHHFQRSVSFTVFKGLYHSLFSKVCIIHHFQRSVSFTIFKGPYHSPFSKVCIIHHFQRTGSKIITKKVIRQVARYDMAV
jgi:hypothetical protein